MPPSTTERTSTGIPAQDPATAPRSERGLWVLLLAGGLIGLVAAVVLLVEKIALLANPDYIPSCNVSPVLSCGSVMTTPQAEAFGIPNPILGIAGFAVVAAIGVGLLAGARFAGWFWAGVQGGVTFAVVFLHWLMYQSLYVIGALCPYCMIVWAVTIPIFWHVTIRNLRVRSTERGTSSRFLEYRGAILTAWFLTIIALIAVRFWDYWTTLL